MRDANLRRFLAKASSTAFVIHVLGTGLAFLSQALVARLLGIETFGDYVYVLSWINVLLVLSTLGVQNMLLRYLASYLATGAMALARGVMRFAFGTVVGGSAVVALVTFAALSLLGEGLEADLRRSFYAGLLILPVLAVSSIQREALRAQKLVFYAASPAEILRPVTIAVLMFITYDLTGGNISGPQSLFVNLGGCVVALAVGLHWLAKYWPEDGRAERAHHETSLWFRTSVPLLLMSGMSVILSKTDVLMLGSIVDTETSGIYSVAARIAGFVDFGLLAINMVLAPMISELYASNRHRELQNLVTFAARGIFWFTLVAIIMVLLLSDLLFAAFGNEFASGTATLRILLLAAGVNSLAGPVGFLMIMTGNQKRAAMVLGLACVLNVGLNALLIPNFGAAGAAWATTAATVFWNIGMLLLVVKTIRINPTVLPLRLHEAA